jgi:hypothetical protein
LQPAWADCYTYAVGRKPDERWDTLCQGGAQRLMRQIKAFNRLKPNDQAQFLADNPNHFLNPYRRPRKGMYGWGGQPGWGNWSRWGGGSGVATIADCGGGSTPAGPGGMPGYGHAGYDWGQQQGLRGQVYGARPEAMRQVYNIPPGGQSGMAMGMGPGPVVPGYIQAQQQPLLVWPIANQGSYGLGR